MVVVEERRLASDEKQTNKQNQVSHWVGELRQHSLRNPGNLVTVAQGPVLGTADELSL